MNKILVLRNKRVFKGLFGCKQDQVLGPPFSHVFPQVGHWSTYLEKTPKVTLVDYCRIITRITLYLWLLPVKRS